MSSGFGASRVNCLQSVLFGLGSNPLKELFIYAGQVDLPDRADTRPTMVVFHCAFLTINRYERGRESDSLSRCFSDDYCNIRFFFFSPDRENLYLRDATAKLYREAAY